MKSVVRDLLSGGSLEDAGLLLAHVLGRDRAWLISHDEHELTKVQTERFTALCERRRLGEPLAYITGSAGFYGRSFSVDARVLVPRPETEHLIDDALVFLQNRSAACVLDVGTGSGAIACTLAAELRTLRADAVDVSAEALTVARENARALRVSERITFFEGDLVAAVRPRRYDCVVANLPYVPTLDIAHAPDPVSFEPRIALDGGPDGLDLYRRLLAGAPHVTLPGGLVLMEAAPPNVHALAALARYAFAPAEVTVGKDYGGRDRYVKVRTPG
ncbi:MAG: peptide chain release factor N(5)-glutamine methyltransferase [Candidatus Eremiobacteraeota bacterium]|nr:peptide chain release factor N(5)-glutamine methyltransferase [Candidatus Eremiobacteraeota bacterium]